MTNRIPVELTDKHIGRDYLSNGYQVSTVILSEEVLAMDNFLSILPLEDRADLSTLGDYETMVFPANEDGVTDWVEVDFRRYSSEEEAKIGHEEIVNKWLSK